MARVNTPEHYKSHMNLLTSKTKSKNKMRIIDQLPEEGYEVFGIRSPSLSNRDFYIHVRMPGVKQKHKEICYFHWNNVDFVFKTTTSNGHKWLYVFNESTEYCRRVDITDIKVSNYAKFSKAQRLARYLIRITIIARGIAQMLIEDFGKQVLQKSNKTHKEGVRVAERYTNVKVIAKKVKNRKFAWREQYYKNIEIQKAKRKRWRDAMKKANDPENIRKTLQVAKEIFADPNNIFSKFFKEHPDFSFDDEDDEFGKDPYSGDLV